MATRLPVGLERRGGWGEAGLSLPDGPYRDALTGTRHEGRVPAGRRAGPLSGRPVAARAVLDDRRGLGAPGRPRCRSASASPGRWARAANGRCPSSPGTDGWYAADVPEARPGRDYGFLLNDTEPLLPDPRSRWQPFGVHGPSRFYDTAFDWTDAGWEGKGLPDSVLYELHIGTFTPEGTFAAAIEKLDTLVELGVTHVELLPVNDFNGEWNWGYDGVLWYAVHEAYGGPDGLKRFVDACHARGLAATFDVVYNHLGPSGNVLPEFGPYLKSGHSTWGDLINLDGESSGPVREYILQNAAMWLSEFHFDALRLDAVHALRDDSPTHILSRAVRAGRPPVRDPGAPLAAHRRIRSERPRHDHAPRRGRVRARRPVGRRRAPRAPRAPDR